MEQHSRESQQRDQRYIAELDKLQQAQKEEIAKINAMHRQQNEKRISDGAAKDEKYRKDLEERESRHTAALR